jgi:hypothetical protein
MAGASVNKYNLLAALVALIAHLSFPAALVALINPVKLPGSLLYRAVAGFVMLPHKLVTAF